ncbi:g6140 [Coccomyxa elongata]
MAQQPFAYTPYYCEENIYKLCQQLTAQEDYDGDLFAVFISNREKLVPILRQTVEENTGGAVVWDYHVIAVERVRGSSRVYDLTSQLPKPCPLELYARRGLGPGASFRLARKFRVVPAAQYLEHFASDRSHMWNQDGVPGWSKPVPPYPAIVARDGQANTLPHYWDMEQLTDDGRYGRVYSEEEFLTLFGGVMGNGAAGPSNA